MELQDLDFYLVPGPGWIVVLTLDFSLHRRNFGRDV